MTAEAKEAIVKELERLALELINTSRNLSSPKKAEGYGECVQRINKRKEEILWSKTD
ncbi:MAG TPA: hypothetical protein VN256_13000 [Pyrinomonadaceae bacterium]|nr:hypothetical protein [Pyrinomonadaceae bacterium]